MRDEPFDAGRGEGLEALIASPRALQDEPRDEVRG